MPAWRPYDSRNSGQDPSLYRSGVRRLGPDPLRPAWVLAWLGLVVGGVLASRSSHDATFVLCAGCALFSAAALRATSCRLRARLERRYRRRGMSATQAAERAREVAWQLWLGGQCCGPGRRLSRIPLELA